MAFARDLVEQCVSIDHADQLISLPDDGTVGLPLQHPFDELTESLIRRRKRQPAFHCFICSHGSGGDARRLDLVETGYRTPFDPGHAQAGELQVACVERELALGHHAEHLQADIHDQDGLNLPFQYDPRDFCSVAPAPTTTG
ncbi:MAG: hypothetical protein JO023_15595 [Chloroflexi bacterium]|nr:hypothetical protein [Chloroflexota bacterium]